MIKAENTEKQLSITILLNSVKEAVEETFEIIVGIYDSVRAGHGQDVADKYLLTLIDVINYNVDELRNYREEATIIIEDKKA